MDFIPFMYVPHTILGCTSHLIKYYYHTSKKEYVYHTVYRGTSEGEACERAAWGSPVHTVYEVVQEQRRIGMCTVYARELVESAPCTTCCPYGQV